ncbi:MAG: cellulase family glycosylhydrolase [Prevotella sp.]|jgi:mannan endo-1,4-beta-mannosidase|nr:cellulase family glycosylhydrolase [Prevotella sp.]
MVVSLHAKSDFIQVCNGHFVRNGKVYYYIGANFWYGAILGSTGQGGDRLRLCRELDAMKVVGIDNLRILVGSDGYHGVKTKVEPTLQVEPGVYNDNILDGLDYLLMEMSKRKMVAVLYLNNSWEWSGGYGFYLEYAGAGKTPRPEEAGYPAYMHFVSQFADNEKAHQLFYDYVEFIISRTNRYTGKKYSDDPTIMSWQIGNEPRAFSKEAIPGFMKWLKKASALIRSVDRNHLISIGSEGSWGCENNENVYSSISADRNIDYCTVHIWPYNWEWIQKDHLSDDLFLACRNTKRYLSRHLAICEHLHKPLVMEEFGYPRDDFSFSPESSTKIRDTYYQYVFHIIEKNVLCNGLFSGCNFWGWGGFARPVHEQWIPGDDYTGDPAQESQGLNSVFLTDISTLKIIREEIEKFREINR